MLTNLIERQRKKGRPQGTRAKTSKSNRNHQASLSLFSLKGPLNKQLVPVFLDVDECASEVTDCEQLCNNNVGNYTCGCYPGYTLSTNGLSCNGQQASLQYFILTTKPYLLHLKINSSQTSFSTFGVFVGLLGKPLNCHLCEGAILIRKCNTIQYVRIYIFRR